MRMNAVPNGLAREDLSPHEVVAILNVLEREPDLVHYGAAVARMTLDACPGDLIGWTPDKRLQAIAASIFEGAYLDDCRVCGATVMRGPAGTFDWPIDLHFCKDRV